MSGAAVAAGGEEGSRAVAPTTRGGRGRVGTTFNFGLQTPSTPNIRLFGAHKVYLIKTLCEQRGMTMADDQSKDKERLAKLFDNNEELEGEINEARTKI